MVDKVSQFTSLFAAVLQNTVNYNHYSRGFSEMCTREFG